MNDSTNLSSASNSSNDFGTLIFINRIVYCYYFLFLIVAGTCGNLLTAITLLRAKLRKYTTCQFMAVCALLNIGVLLTNTMNMMLTQGHGIHVRSLFDLGWCRVNVFVAQWIRGMASWVLVIVAFDRFQQSKSVRRTPTGQNHRVLFTMLGTGFVLAVLNLHYLLFLGSRVTLDESIPFLACIFYKQSNHSIQRFFALTGTWQELVTIIIVPCILTLILNIFIIKRSFLKPINNEHLKSRSKSRTRRVTTMLLASNIGFLALVGPPQIFFALTFDPQRGNTSPEYYKSFMIQGNIYQCLINTYYAASFVFCFASSSMFRREIKKLLQRSSQVKYSVDRNQTQVSGVQCSAASRTREYGLERTAPNRGTISITEGDELLDQ